MNKNELYNVVGGTNSSLLSGTFLNAVSKLVTTFLTLGRSVGSAIYYGVNKKTCSM